MRAFMLPMFVSMLCTAVGMAGCEATDSGAPANPSVSGALRPLAASVTVYVTQSNGSGNGIIYGYGAQNRRNRPPACKIEGQSFDHSQIAVDASGNVYSPSLADGTINVYAPHCGRLIAAVKDPYGSDVDVAVGNGGTFYGVGGTHVSVCTTSACTRELTDPSIAQLETAAVDASGNVWATYYAQQHGPALIVWRDASMPGKIVSGYVNQNTPGDLQFDHQGTLISLQTLFSHVYLYNCNAATAQCTNTKTLSLHGGSLYGSLNAANTDYQATDYPNDAVDVYAYPSFTYKYSYSRGLIKGSSAQGLAQTP